MAEWEFSEPFLAEGVTSSRSRSQKLHEASSFTVLAFSGALVCLVAVSLVAASVPGDQAFGRGLVELLIVGAPIASGLYVLRSGANRRFALALIWIGFAWSVTALTVSPHSVPYTIGRIWTWLILPSAVYLLFAFPGGRIARGFDRAVFGGFVAVWLLLFLGTAPLVQAFPPKTLWTPCVHCPPNAVFILDQQPAVLTQVVLVREWLIELLWLGLGWSMFRRWHAASPLQRKAIAPVFAVGALLGLFQIAHITYRQLGGSTDTAVALSSAWTLSIAALCATFPLSLFWHRRLLGRTLTSLGATLRESASPERVRDALATALGDPGLDLLFHDPKSEQWTDSSGRPQIWPQPTGPARVATAINRQGDAEEIVLVHDVALRDDEELLEGVAGLVVAARRHQQLASSLRQAASDLEDSRRRIAEAADQERARIERDLHDGAQQRLVAISIKLAHAQEDMKTDPEGAAVELGQLSLELDLAMRELQSLAAGIYPPVLATYGIAPALKALSLSSPLPVHVSDGGLARHPMELETAVYFTIAEAMQNATKHAHDATGIWIHLSESTNALYFQVSDDGAGMAAGATPGHGLQNMRDRIEAIGGRVTIESGGGRGIQVTGSVPLLA